MSEMTTQADFRPRARSASGGVPLGRSNSWRRTPAGSTSGGASLYANLRTSRSLGNSTSKPVRPYSKRKRTFVDGVRGRVEHSLPARFSARFGGAGGGRGGSGLSFSPFLFLL